MLDLKASNSESLCSWRFSSLFLYPRTVASAPQRAGSSSDLDIRFCFLPAAATGTLVVDTLAGNSTHVLGSVMLLHHMRNSHASLVLDYNV